MQVDLPERPAFDAGKCPHHLTDDPFEAIANAYGLHLGLTGQAQTS
ncbi:MAG: hypothetical protein WBD31_28495 [Rubripirellula sp.]